MKTLHKANLGAISVIANGVAALLLSSPAHADSCAPANACVTQQACSNLQATCEILRPGCTYASGACVPPQLDPFCSGFYRLLCSYN